jgi:hypothetical protein
MNQETKKELECTQTIARIIMCDGNDAGDTREESVINVGIGTMAAGPTR